ncbi:MAG TPA: DUF333 domain-containing protein [Gaiellaceae bacterium]|nr:DUF333 domain-containing protein [Gaiellaceae bacterium]
MKNVILAGIGALLSFTVACAAPTDRTAEDSTDLALASGQAGDEAPADEPAPNMANPAAVHCESLGHRVEGDDCVLAGGGRCEQWAFYRGECGGARSFCARQGGVVSTKTEDMGTWVASYAVCTLAGGGSCKEQDFARTCDCE